MVNLLSVIVLMNSKMPSENLIAKAITYLNSLANGVNPYTEVRLTPGDFDDERLKRLFRFVAGTLSERVGPGEEAKKGGIPGINADPRPYFDAEKVRPEKIEISETPIGVNTLARNICASFDPMEMQGISGAAIADWLALKGYLKIESFGGKKRKVLGWKCSELGLTEIEGVHNESGERYVKILYPPQAQRFVIENLRAIAAWRLSRRSAPKNNGGRYGNRI